MKFPGTNIEDPATTVRKALDAKRLVDAAAIKITEQRLERIGKIPEQNPPDNAPEK